MTVDVRLGFTGSAIWRLGAVALFAAVAFTTVLVVERTPAAAATTAIAPIVNTGTASTLRLESTYAVATWTVQGDGKPLSGTAGDPQHWQGIVPAGTRELFIQADAQDAGASGPAALRWNLGGPPARNGLLWGQGFVAERVTLETRP